MINSSLLGFGAALALTIAGCSSTISGHPSQGTPVTPLTSSAGTNTTPDFPTSSTISGAAPGCVAAADYCDTFDNPGSGWPAENPSHYFARYDSYNGGSYQMGERTDAALSEDAPYNVTDAAKDHSVQVDVDAAIGQNFGATNEIGIVCWEHPIEGGGGTTSAFLLELSETEATIGLWDGTDGSYHEITSAAAPNALSPTGWTHLTGLCLLGTPAGSTQAQLSLTVNAALLVSATYAKSVRTYDWDVGDRVGLLAIGEGSDVFYDNFAVTGRCAGVGC
jgi:hypothetical protein